MSSRENIGGGGDILEEDLIFENLMAVKHMLLDVMETQDHANISGMYQSTSGYFRLYPKMSRFFQDSSFEEKRQKIYVKAMYKNVRN